jgi:hypothetical protein
MILNKLSKQELLVKCEELGITKCKTKTKNKLIELINEKISILNKQIPDIEEVKNNKNTLMKINNVLTLCKIPESINIIQIKEQINEYMKSRIEFYKTTQRSLFIEDEFSEYFIAVATNGIVIGKGHCGMDVKTYKNEGIDVMCVIMNKGISNEKSLIQNFKTSGCNLDTLFNEKKHNDAVRLYMVSYLEKLEKVRNEKELNNLYILAFISTDKDIYIACFNLNIELINNVVSGGFIHNKQNNNVNIVINNFIPIEDGKVTLYKSKKRVELRLYNSILENENVIKIYTML